MEGVLTMPTSIAGVECNLQIFRHCFHDKDCYSIDVFEKNKLKGIYYIVLNEDSGEYQFAGGQVPYNIKEEESNIANSILSYYRSHCNERAVA
jgi:hypothetical protein